MFRQKLGNVNGTGDQVITSGVAVAVGETVIVTITMGTSNTIVSVVDSVGNTYTVDFQSASGTRRVAIASAPVTVAITTSTTITVDISGTGDCRVAAYEYAGLLTAAGDKTNGAVSAAATTLATGSSGTLTQKSEVIISVLGGPAITGMTYPAGYNTRATGIATNALYVCDLTVYDTTAVDLTWSWTTSSACAALVATYKRAADNFMRML